MYSFNVVMLSRQIWRLIQNPDTLCAKLLKAKYFPDTHILEAARKDGISYAWRSLLHGLELFKEGYICRFGDGMDVNIWVDPWIPRPWLRHVITSRGAHLLERVCDLIDPATGN